MVKFIFDLDGTVTSVETLPIIAKHYGIEKHIESLTMKTVSGNIPFIESFINRVHLMATLPVDGINDLLEETAVYPHIQNFINEHKNDCIIATGNLDCWVEKLCRKVGCKAFTSKAIVKDNEVFKLTNILRKETIVREYQNQGYTVVVIGEGNNDLEAMRAADISIASGLTHKPANSVLGIVDYVIYEEEALCRQLNQLL